MVLFGARVFSITAAAFAGALGSGSVSDRIARATEGTEKEVKKVNQILKQNQPRLAP